MRNNLLGKKETKKLKFLGNCNLYVSRFPCLFRNYWHVHEILLGLEESVSSGVNICLKIWNSTNKQLKLFSLNIGFWMRQFSTSKYNFCFSQKWEGKKICTKSQPSKIAILYLSIILENITVIFLFSSNI